MDGSCHRDVSAHISRSRLPDCCVVSNVQEATSVARQSLRFDPIAIYRRP